MTDSIAAVVNLHREGNAALPSLISAWRAVEAAQASRIDARLVLVLDSPDAETVALAERWRSRGASIISTDVADLGAARNTAAQTLDATWLAFLDADDLWGEAWLVAAHAMAANSATTDGDVFHPQTNIIFGNHHSLLHHIDSDGPEFRWSRFHLHNAWTALCFVRREQLLALPYPRNDLANGFGFEDWSWNMAVLDSGGRHRVVADTCHFIQRTDPNATTSRRKSEPSLLVQSQRALRSRYPGVVSPQRSAADDRPSFDVDIDPDAGTHEVKPVELSHEIFRQIHLAATIEPSISDTLSSRGKPSLLPQNFNSHNTAAQRALEELWWLRARASEGPASPTVGELCDQSTLLPDLSAADRATVVAEFLLSEKALGREVGQSPLVAAATSVYSQLASAP